MHLQELLEKCLSFTDGPISVTLHEVVDTEDGKAMADVSFVWHKVVFSEPEPEPGPEPESENVVAYIVTADKSLAHTIGSLNKAGKPVMKIAEPRIIFKQGEQVNVAPEVISGDGGSSWYLISGSTQLYMDANKGRLA